MTKTCTTCRSELSLDQFRDVNRRDRVEKHPWCHECLRKYNAAQYQKHKDKRDAAAKKYRQEHPERIRELGQASQRRYRERNPEAQNVNTHKAWVMRLKHRGLTPEDYYRILAEQGGGCAICGVTEPGKPFGKFAADHCHKTGVSRGLLCHRCNRGLGYFRDNPEFLVRAAEYLSNVDLPKE